MLTDAQQDALIEQMNRALAEAHEYGATAAAATAQRIKLRLYGEGPWTDEPDKFAGAFAGFECLILRGYMGQLCGYVRLPRAHPWAGRHYEELPVSVHGGLTWGDVCPPLSMRRGDRLPARYTAWWIGFDCAHGFDVMPRLVQQLRSMGRDPSWMFEPLPGMHGPAYRDADYVRAAVKSLAWQCQGCPEWVEYVHRSIAARTPRQRRQAAVYASLVKRQARGQRCVRDYLPTSTELHRRALASARRGRAS